MIRLIMLYLPTKSFFNLKIIIYSFGTPPKMIKLLNIKNIHINNKKLMFGLEYAEKEKLIFIFMNLQLIRLPIYNVLKKNYFP